MTSLAPSSGRSHSASYLFDATNREVFESAHSVMLAIFTDHAHTLDAHVILDHALDRSSFVPKLIPFYVSCLIEVSGTQCPGVFEV